MVRSIKHINPQLHVNQLTQLIYEDSKQALSKKENQTTNNNTQMTVKVVYLQIGLNHPHKQSRFGLCFQHCLKTNTHIN